VVKAHPTLTVIDVQRQRIKPPSYLKAEARAVFLEVVDCSAPSHFKQNEVPLLAMYASAVHLARFYCDRIGSERDDGSCHRLWIENAKLALSIATKLRLSPQTRYDARAAQRKQDEPNDITPPWEAF
jgi:phage terminase small subunit